MRALEFALLAVCAASLNAADFYVDPINGSAAGTGTAGDPWLTIQQVVSDNLIESRDWDTHPYSTGASLQTRNPAAPVKAGDTIWLRDGYHGELILNGWYNSSAITIAAQAGHTPQLSRVSIIGAQNWTLDGLSVSLEHAPSYTQQTIITLRDDSFWGPASHLTVRNCDVYCVNDTSAFTAQDWLDNHATAFDMRSADSQLIDNTIRNTRYAIACSGPDCIVRGNVIENFSGDGIRGLGDYGLYEYNVVKNAIDVGDAHHDDGFQSWTVGSGGVGTGAVTGIILRGNLFINHENPTHPLRTTMQGIGCFDGFFDDWVIENNVVITDHWHGITLLGARNCRIVNNTVIDLYTGTPGPSWIEIGHHKTLGPSENCVIRNNLANTISIPSGQTNVIEDHNITVTNPALHFVDPLSFDMRLLDTSSARDAGSNSLSPSLDADQIGRPYNSTVDVGAYEWHPPGWTGPPGGGGGGGDGGSGGDGGCSTMPRQEYFWVGVLLLCVVILGQRLIIRRTNF
ncbi:MAG: hypothetical protein K8I27_10495 [Planctomycetes bacterium]|nr:hypothetical protein [Planctomycetota bacterium]